MSHSVLSLHVGESSGTILSDNASATLGVGQVKVQRLSPHLTAGPIPHCFCTPRSATEVPTARTTHTIAHKLWWKLILSE